jgi:hypothetical protein
MSDMIAAACQALIDGLDSPALRGMAGASAARPVGRCSRAG